MTRMLMMPYDSVNLYQAQLRQGLEANGIAVSFSTWHWRLPLFGEDAPDVLHIHWLHNWARTRVDRYAAGLLILIYQLYRYKRSGGVVIWTVHNLCQHEGLYVRREWLLGRLFALLASSVIVHSYSAVVPAMERFNVAESKFSVIPHPVYPSPCDVVSKESARSRLGIASDDFLFVCAGNMRPYKGVEDLIEAYGQAALNSCGLIIGGWPLSEKYAEEIKDLAENYPSITLWLRRLEEEELHLLLLAADVVVLPYRAILTSGALVLAMGAGRACIAPRMGVFEEHLADGGGILYEPGIVDALAAALREAATQRDNLVAMGDRNRAMVAEWSPEAVGAQMAALIQQSLPARRKGKA